MEIPLTQTEIQELQYALDFSNLTGETRETLEQFILRLIRHNIIATFHSMRMIREGSRRTSRIAQLPPAGVAELEALLAKYSLASPVISTEKDKK